jgi:hypothetical protein
MHADVATGPDGWTPAENPQTAADIASSDFARYEWEVGSACNAGDNVYRHADVWCVGHGVDEARTVFIADHLCLGSWGTVSAWGWDIFRPKAEGLFMFDRVQVSNPESVIATGVELSEKSTGGATLPRPQSQKPEAPSTPTESQPTPVHTDGDKPQTPNPFNPARFRMSANYAAALGVKKVITNVACRKPNRQEWVRVRPGEEWRLETMILEEKTTKASYLVDPQISGNLVGEIVPVGLFLAITRQNDPFLWMVKLPGIDGRTNDWNDSALKAAKLAETQWVRMAADMNAGHYLVWEATAPLPDPEWPNLTFNKLLEICFRNRIISDINHIILKRLRGEV